MRQTSSPVDRCISSSVGHVFCISNQMFSTASSDGIIETVASSERALERLLRFIMMADFAALHFFLLSSAIFGV